MNTCQKIIKYFAIGLAFFLIFLIITGIYHGVTTISSLFVEKDIRLENMKQLELDDTIKKIDIDIKETNLIIKTSEKLSAETNNKNITVKEKNNKLYIEEKESNHWFFNNSDETELIVYIPNETFEQFNIESGVSKINIDSLNTKKLNLDLGVGNVIINNLNVSEKTDIDSGVGKLIIENGIVNDLNLDTGVGDVNLKFKVLGESDIDAGIGKVTLNLIGIEEDYKLRLSKGIGTIKVNDNETESDTTYGTGESIITIDGGIGSINVSFIESNN